MKFGVRKLESRAYQTLAFFVLTQYRLVSDGRTDRRTGRHVAITKTLASIALRGWKCSVLCITYELWRSAFWR